MIWHKGQARPTKLEAERITLIMGMCCIVCALHGDVQLRPRELHHIVRNNKRLGPWFSLQICAGHHRGVWDLRSPQPVQVAISDGSKAFRKAHGGMDDLQIWQRQQVILGYDDALPTSKIYKRPQTEAERVG